MPNDGDDSDVDDGDISDKISSVILY